jgi:tRNA A-37 threonylcarbamoyl transferase component Bud32
MTAATGRIDETTTLSPGEALRGTPYRIVRLLGAGAMGEVYEAEHELLGTRRALKVLAPQHAHRSDLVERMRVEARALAQLRHKNLVEVLDLGIAEGERWFFAMEKLDGRTLRDVLESEGFVAPRVAAQITAEILEGLAAAHSAGLIHRDVKPENVFVCANGVVKVLDFGIAKLVQQMSGVQLTQAGFTIGTPRYMAPEQIEGKPVDTRTDLYAVGVLLYELLAGTVPFEEDDPLALAYAHAMRIPDPLSARARQPIAPALEALVHRALEKRADARFATAAEFAAALRALGPTLSATVPSPLEAADRGGTMRMEPLAAGAVPTGPSDARDLGALAVGASQTRAVVEGGARAASPPGASGSGDRPLYAHAEAAHAAPGAFGTAPLLGVGSAETPALRTGETAVKPAKGARNAFLFGAAGAVVLASVLVFVMRPSSRSADASAGSDTAPTGAESTERSVDLAVGPQSPPEPPPGAAPQAHEEAPSSADTGAKVASPSPDTSGTVGAPPEGAPPSAQAATPAADAPKATGSRGSRKDRERGARDDALLETLVGNTDAVLSAPAKPTQAGSGSGDKAAPAKAPAPRPRIGSGL